MEDIVSKILSEALGVGSDENQEPVNEGFFPQNEDNNKLLNEAILYEAYGEEGLAQLLAESGDYLVADNILLEKSFIILDKEAKQSQAYSIAVLNTARERNDHDYQTYVKLKAATEVLAERLGKRYKAEATVRVREQKKAIFAQSRVSLTQMIAKEKKSDSHGSGGKFAKGFKGV
jgi:hypothetical protein